MMSSIPETTAFSPLSVLIIGGGLSGIAIAHELVAIQKSNIKNHNISPRWHLLESQNYIGGRIKSDNITKQIDMGGAWIWPSQQKIKKLIRDLKLTTIRQCEEDDGRVRIQGGASRIIEGMTARLNDQCITLSATVIECVKMDNAVKVTFVTGLSNISDSTVPPQQHVVYTERIVCTVPPRMSLPPLIKWDPPLSSAKMMAQKQTNTWMASVTKVMFMYHKKHWDVSWLIDMKRRIRFYRNGPVFDLYDSCFEEVDHSNVYAFTVFALLDWKDQKNCDLPQRDERSASVILNHLISIAPSQSSSFQTTHQYPSVQSETWMPQYAFYFVHHWSQVKSISDDPRPEFVGLHPRPNPTLSQPEWKSANGNNMVYFAGTESDLRSPGLMEGALGSAYRVIEEFKETWL
ncbi:hypothetical protein ACHAW6_002054, partial [Cyclotella cf. meneghiniana]